MNQDSVQYLGSEYYRLLNSTVLNLANEADINWYELLVKCGVFQVNK